MRSAAPAELGRRAPLYLVAVPYLFYYVRVSESSPRALPPKWANEPVPAPLHAVAQDIAAGESWLVAWAMLSTVPYRRLSRESGIGEERLRNIERGAPITRSDLIALAKAWKVDASAIVLTLPAGTLLPDPPQPIGPVDVAEPSDRDIDVECARSS